MIVTQIELKIKNIIIKEAKFYVNSMYVYKGHYINILCIL